MNAITTSVFELFKIGPGPSSSHTIGPMRAGYHFLQLIRSLPPDVIRNAEEIEVRLFGSLSATGKGHGTDRAVLAGILGHEPETCAPDVLDGLRNNPAESYEVDVGGSMLKTGMEKIIFDKVAHEFPYSNTLLIRLMGNVCLSSSRNIIPLEEVSCDGRGGKSRNGGACISLPIYAEIGNLLAAGHMRLHEMMLENERAITGMNEKEICQARRHNESNGRER